MRRLAIGLVLGAAAFAPGAAFAPPAAHADIYSQVLHTYQAQGSIPPCRFTSAQLSAALKGIDTYGAQYFADFTDAVQAALAQRASGACIPSSSQPGTLAGGAGPPLHPGSLTAATDASVPAPIVAMAALGLAIAMAFAVRVLARRSGWEPAWAARWGHACAEASYRIGGGMSAFADWWRWGR